MVAESSKDTSCGSDTHVTEGGEKNNNPGMIKSG
jgi:hypothetical protein